MIFTYLTAMLWMTLLISILDFYFGRAFHDLHHFKDKATLENLYGFRFLIDYNMKDKSNQDNVILLIYFSFTSLSTVGLGDYAPRSDLERIIGAMMLMFGVAIFSYIMGIFIEILEGAKNLTAEFSQGDRLAMFIGTLRKYNKNVAIDADFNQELMEYFEYRWMHDRSREFISDEGAHCMD